MNRCDNRTVGVFATDTDGRVLLVDRTEPPTGLAPPSTHLDGRGAADAARAVMADHLGLQVLTLELVARSWTPDRCTRARGPVGIGHLTTAYRATVAGDLDPDGVHVRSARWADRDAVERAVARAFLENVSPGGVAGWDTDPGMAAPWVGMLVAAEIIDLDTLRTVTHSGLPPRNGALALDMLDASMSLHFPGRCGECGEPCNDLVCDEHASRYEPYIQAPDWPEDDQ